mgnify:CR=1 FL=1
MNIKIGGKHMILFLKSIRFKNNKLNKKLKQLTTIKK